MMALPPGGSTPPGSGDDTDDDDDADDTPSWAERTADAVGGFWSEACAGLSLFAERLGETRTPRPGERAGDVVEFVSDVLAAVGAWGTFLPVAIAGRTVQEGSKIGMSILGKILPIGTPFEDLAKWAINRSHKRRGGDAVGIVFAEDGQIDFEPVKHKTVDLEEGEQAGWFSKDRDRQPWHEGAGGRDVDWLGKAPVVLLDAASQQRATAFEARYAEALDLDNVDAVYNLDHGGQVTVEPQIDAVGATGGEALADGGVAEDAISDVRLKNVKGAIWDQHIVDIDGSPDTDGMRIDPRKVKETYRQKTGADQLAQATELGFQAGRSDERDLTGVLIKMMLIALGIVAAATIGPDLLGAASQSGGGGSLVPFTLMGWG